jgi:hypothetical protein
VKSVEKSLYWFTIATGILSNVLLSFALIPVLVAAKPMMGLLILLFFGGLLGSLIIFISDKMHWFEDHHRLSFALIIPVFGFFTLYLLVGKVNEFNRFVGFSNQHNPVLSGLVYFIGFLIPYIIVLVLRRLGIVE